MKYIKEIGIVSVVVLLLLAVFIMNQDEAWGESYNSDGFIIYKETITTTNDEGDRNIEYTFVIEDSEFGIAHATVEKEKYDSLNEGDSIKTIVTVGFLFKNLYVKSVDKDLSL